MNHLALITDRRLRTDILLRTAGHFEYFSRWIRGHKSSVLAWQLGHTCSRFLAHLHNSTGMVEAARHLQQQAHRKLAL